MTALERPAAQSQRWRNQLVAAIACSAFGVIAYALSPFISVQIEALLLGVGLISASFLLAWAADAGEGVFSGGLVLAVVALVTVLPEFIIEIRFAFIQASDLVTANLTGATRLLLTGAVGLPLVVAYLAKRRGEAEPTVKLGEARRLELGILLVTAIFAIHIAVRGNLTIFDAVVLLGLYVLYARRVKGSDDEEPAVVGVAAGLLSLPEKYRRAVIVSLILFAGAVVVLIANPFADALLESGTQMGIDPYLLIQSVVPLATEAPEFVVVTVLVVNRKPAQALALFLAASVSQWTLGMGSLPVAYLAGGGGLSMPLAAREQLEVGFTIAVTLFVVAALATLRPQRVDAYLILTVFAVQMVFPTPFVRFAAAMILLIFAIDLLIARRRTVRPLLRTGFGRRRSPRVASE